MARIKKYSPEQNLSSFQTFIVDENPNSEYFRITEFKDTFTGGKNGFLIEGSEYLKESTEIKIELLDVAGNPIYYEPGNGIPEYYEGISKLVAVYIYNDTPIGLGKITVLGELKEYDDNGVKRQIPDEWKGAYNVKWERTFQINKLLANEDKVRFYRRPDVTIDEIVKPIFSGNPPSVTQIGSLDGIPLVPIAGTNLSNFTIPTSYRLKVNSGNKWTGSIEGQTISFDNITYSPTIDEVVNETEIIVSPPYSENNIVASFTNEDYSLTFPYIEGVGDLATALTGSFAKISITDMKTFVGDAARVKVFRRSQSNLTDFEFVQEIQLESNEVLRDITTFAKKEESYGFFTQQVIDDYWVTSSNDMNVTFNQNFLYNSTKLDSSPNNYFITSQSFSIQTGVEYTLDFNARLSGSVVSGDYLKVFLSGSNNGTGVSQTITTINASNGVLQKTNFNENIIADTFDSAKLYFEVSGSDWYINNVSLKASQETSFSPDEITFIQQVPKTLVEETFDYRFEFYDINNNFIPVRVDKTKTFVGGNTNLFEKSIEITPDNLYFSFDSASNPANAIPPTIINFDVETNLVTGSITYTSGAYDFRGNLLSSSQYAGGQYPGYLTDWNVDLGRQPFLRVQDFTGSREDIVVQFIRYTGEVEGVSDTFVITRVEDGKGGVSFEIVPFRGLQIKNKESKTLEIQAVRVDGINRIQLRDGLERGFSDAKLHVLSSSLDGTQTYVSLSQAITNPDFLEGVSAGTTGSGEIDYNAIFTRDAIDNELTVYLMDGPTSESILTSQILTDLKDGLNPGLVTATTEQFNIKYKPREVSQFDPLQSIVTASFQRRGTTLNPLSASLVIKPSSSIQPLTELPQYYMFYETGAFDNNISLIVTDFVGNVIDNGVPGVTLDETSGLPISFYQSDATKQLNLEFTYTEPITSASVTANKSFFITPDGLPGQDAINIDIDPNPIALGSNHKGEVFNYSLANTDIQISQGDYFLINSASGNPGTFTTRSIVTNNIVYGTLDGNSTTTMSLAGFESMSALSASVRYDFDIYPYFTASLVTASRTQKFTKVVEGGGAIEVTLDPIAVTLNADEGGFVSDYTKASTEVFIKQNDDFFFYDEFGGGRPGTFVTASISASNIEFTELSSSFRDLSVSGSVSSSGGEILHFKGFGGLDRNQPSASITYNFKVYPYSLKGGVAGVPRIVSKTQTFSKVNDGTAARKVALAASSDTIIYNGDGVKVSPTGTLTLTATAFNTTGSAYYKFLDDEGGTIQVSSTDNTLNNVSPLPGTGSVRTYTVELRDGNANGSVVDTDSVSISGVSEGATAYSAQLSNPASSVTVEVDGTTYFDNAGTLIRAYKGGQELQYVEQYNESAVDPITFLPIGTFGQFSASVHEISSFLTQGTLRDGKEIVSKSISPTEDELFASASAVTNWNLPQDNTQGYIIYKIDFENGRGTQFLQQSFSTVFEGATGPGLVVRGEWDETIAYIFDLTQKRRDAVFRDVSGTVHYWATTEDLIQKSEYTEESDGLGNDDGVYTGQPTVPVSPNGVGYVDPTTGWQYLGEQDFFVAAKLAIFEESFVKNTINVGIPPAGNQNANIAIVGGTDEPYISVGQTGTQGFRQPGVFIGMTNDFGSSGTAGTTGILSLKSSPIGSPPNQTYNSMEWDGNTLTIRGAIRQTAAGVIEPSLRGTWASGTEYYPQDLVQYLGETWSSDTQHTSTNDTNASTGVPGSGPWTIAAGAGKGVNLIADSYVIAYDAAGGSPSPSGTMTLTANSSNFVDGYFKFTGGGAVFTDETTFTDGTGANTDTATFTIPTSYFSTPLQFRVGVAEGDQDEKVSDTITISAVQPGADTSPQYFITPIAGGTQLKNSGGTIELQVQKSDSTGLSDVTSGWPQIYDGASLISVGGGVSDGGNGVTYNPILNASAISGTKVLSLKDSGGNVLDTITLLDVTDGLGGGSFISPNLKSTRNPVTNNYAPSFLSLTASFYDTSGTEYTKAVKITPNYSSGTDYMYYDNNSSEHTDSEISLTIDDGDGTVFSGTGIGNKLATKDVVVTATFTDPATSQTSTMVETVYIISDGVDGLDAITVINTNQAHTLPASDAGVVSSFAGSGTTIEVYEGTTKLAYDVTPDGGDWYISGETITPTGDFTIDSSPTIGADYIEYGNGTAMDNATDSVTITYTITGKRINGEAFTAQTIQTITKSKAGVDGVSTTGFRIEYSTSTTAADPGSGKFRFNATDPASATEVYISETDLQGLGVDPILDVLTTSTNTPNKSIITFRQIANQAYYDSAYVTSQTDNGGWRTLDITHIDKSGWGNVGNGDAMFMAISVLGDKGVDGASGEAAGIVYAGEWTKDLPDGSTPTAANKVAYLGEDDLKYVAKYETGGNTYWVTAITHRYAGAWSSGQEYILNDIVSYIGTYWRANSAVTGVGTTNPPNTNASWDSLGVASNLVPGTLQLGGVDAFDSFGAEFTSVATDILFAQDVYADKTVNIGSKGGSPVIALNADDAGTNANPFIAIGQDTFGFGEDGIYFGYDGGNPVLSMVTGSSYLVYESGSVRLSDASLRGTGSIIEGSEIRVGRNLLVSPTASNAYNFTVSTTGIVSASEAFIQGRIEADAGNIGDWVIDSDTRTLRDNDSEIIFDPNIPEIQMYSGSLKRLYLGNRGQLSEVAASGDTLSWAPPEAEIPTGNFNTNAATFDTENEIVYTAVTDNTTPLSAGTYTVSGISWPQLTIDSSGLGTIAAGTQSTPNDPPEFAGQIHGGPFQRNNARAIQAYLYLELVDTTNGNAVLDSQFLGFASAQGNFTVSTTQRYWQAVNINGGGGFQSVVGDTEITLFDGTTKLAKDIKIGDVVLSWNSDAHLFEGITVSNIFNREVSVLYKIKIGGNEILVSDSHGFWLGKNKKAYAKDLLVGDTLYVRVGDSIEMMNVDSVEIIESTEEVYTFTVPNTHNYVSNDIVSHNYALPGEDLEWQRSTFIPTERTAQNGTISAGSNVEKNFTINQASSAVGARFKLLMYADKGFSTSCDSSGQTFTTTYNTSVDYAQTSGTGVDVYFASSQIDSSVVVEKQNNYVEIQPGGINLVTSEDVYAQIRRRDSLTLTGGYEETALMSVISGSTILKAPGTNPDNQYGASIHSEGSIIPESADKWTLGQSALRWHDVHTEAINGINAYDWGARTVGAVVKFRGRNDLGTISTYSPKFNVASVTKTADAAGEGEGQYYRVTFDDAMSNGCPFVASYGRQSGDTASQNVTDAEFTNNMGVKPVNTMAYVDIGFRDNDTNTLRDPYEAYFMVLGATNIDLTTTT
jgi:hypothetical protein